MAIIRFAINVPQQVRLMSLEGRIVDSQFGGQQYLFHAAEGQFYVSDKVGQILQDQFRKLNIKAGEPVEITVISALRAGSADSMHRSAAHETIQDTIHATVHEKMILRIAMADGRSHGVKL